MKIKPANSIWIKRIERSRSYYNDVNHPVLHMFRQDYSDSIMPMVSSAIRRAGFSVSISGQDADRARVTLRSLMWRGRSHRNLDVEIVSGVINDLSSYLFHYGEANFEIISDGLNLKCSYFDRCDVLTFCGYFIQLIRPLKSMHSFRIARLPNVWTVSFPKSLYSRLFYRFIIFLIRHADPLFPPFHMEEMMQNKGNSKLDMKMYDLLRASFVSRVTKRFGWQRRDHTTEKQTQFFSIFRGAKTNLCKALVREHLASELNNLLSALGLDAKINIEGLLSSAELIDIISQLKTGKILMHEYLDKVHH